MGTIRAVKKSDSPRATDIMAPAAMPARSSHAARWPTPLTDRKEIATDPSALGQDSIDDLGRNDAGEFLIKSLELECELVVIEAEEVEHGCMEVPDMHGVLHDVVGKIIRLAEAHPGLHASTGHPHREATRMMIPPIVVRSQYALRINSPAEFAAPKHDGVV